MFFCLLCAFFTSVRIMQKSNDVENTLFRDNVEALADGEIISQTSWKCSGTTKYSCGARCGVCRTAVQGTGSLTGEHKCISTDGEPAPAPSNPDEPKQV